MSKQVSPGTSVIVASKVGNMVCNIDPQSAWKTGWGVRQDVDESRVVTTDCGNGGFLTGNRTQEVVGSIPISSTK